MLWGGAAIHSLKLLGNLNNFGTLVNEMRPEVAGRTGKRGPIPEAEVEAGEQEAEDEAGDGLVVLRQDEPVDACPGHGEDLAHLGVRRGPDVPCGA